MATTPKRYKPNDGWLSVKLPTDVNAKLREIHERTRLSLTAVVCNGIEHEWREWQRAGWKTGSPEKP